MQRFLSVSNDRYDCPKVVERFFCIAAPDHEPLTDPKPAAVYGRHELLVDDPAFVDQHVAPGERVPEPLPAILASKLDQVDAGVLPEQSGSVVEALEDVAPPADQVGGIGDAVLELLAGEHLEQADHGFEGVDSESLEDTGSAQRLSLLFVKVIFDSQ